MRALVVQLSPGFSGTERHAAELATGLAAEAEVAIVLRTPPGPPHDLAPYLAMRRLVPASIPTYLVAGRLPQPGLLAAIARFRPDILHAHGGRSARIAAGLGRLLRIPSVATLHLRYTTTDFARCSGLIALTDAERDRTACRFARSVAVIPNWVTPWLRPTSARLAELRASLAIPPDAFLFGSIGRLVAVKRMAGLFDAFAAADLPQAHLLIAGEGEERAMLLHKIEALGLQARIHLVGYRADARDLYAMFDCFVLNSSFEPYALVLLEAAEQGTPIIATATDGAVAIARLSPITLVPIDGSAALAQTLRSTFDQRDPPPPARFCRADRVADTLAFYRRIVAAQRHQRISTS